MARKRSTEARRRQRANKAERKRLFKRKELMCTRATHCRRLKLIRLSGMQNHRCCYCGIGTWHPQIEDGDAVHDKRRLATLDHIKTVSRGGTFGMFNLVMACSECNTIRGNMSAFKFLKEIQTMPPPPVPKKAKVLSPEEIKKAARKHNNLMCLLIIAARFFPEDYAYFMENENPRMGFAVFQGGRRVRGRNTGLKNIRSRVKDNRMAA